MATTIMFKVLDVLACIAMPQMIFGFQIYQKASDLCSMVHPFVFLSILVIELKAMNGFL